MAMTRPVIRWTLTLVALLLAGVALLVLLARLALGLADGLVPRLEALLSARFAAEVRIASLEGGLAYLDPHLSLDDLSLSTREGDRPLLEVRSGHLRLDSWQSLREGLPVVEDARLEGVTLHLYQTPDGGWHWPDPAELPPELQPEGELDLERIDFWVGVLLRQRAWAERVNVVLHGRERRVAFEAPRLLMTGDDRRAHLEGELRLVGDRDIAMQVALEVLPGPRGLGDFNAALQVELRLDSLVELAAVLGNSQPLRLDEARGEASLWGRWQGGSLADARLALDIERLAVSHRDAAGERHDLELDSVTGRGQWLKGESGWQAWFQGDAESPDASEPDVPAPRWGPALPYRWHLSGDADGWWLNTSAFDLGSLAAWRDRVPLPEALARVVESLDPRGRVMGFGLGFQEGEWQARAALHGVEVSPWQQAPGGGPLDMWVEARGGNGLVRFVGGDAATLHFPEIFAGPMALEHASGEVRWVYDGPRSMVSGRDLRVGWNGAEVSGGFGLSIGLGARGGFGLTLALEDVDAVETPLVEWLPVGILGDELRDWLADGVAGRVPEGALRLHVPLSGGSDEHIAANFGLDLAIRDGRLPIAPGWPMLEGIEGRMRLDNAILEAEVSHAESLGVEAHGGRIRLADEHLEVEGTLAADAEALRDFLRAMPVDGMQALDDWRAEGRAEGTLSLALPLGDPEAMALTVATQAAFPRLEYVPLGLAFRDLEGPLTWRQQGGAGGLEGRLEGRALGGPVRAAIDTTAGGLDLSGRAEITPLLALVDASALAGSLAGAVDWQGRLAIADTSVSLSLASDLTGLAIDLPSPLGKAAGEVRPLRLDMDLTRGRLEGRLGEALALRWRRLDGTSGQGQVWLGRPPASNWPTGAGWWVDAYLPRLSPAAWGEALSGLLGDDSGAAGGALGLREMRLASDCLHHDDRCLGSFYATARPQTGGGWRLALDGSLLEGQLDYRPQLAEPLDIGLARLSLDALMPGSREAGSLFDEIAIPPEPQPLPGWVADLPDGRLRVADIERAGQRLGPLTARWQATPERLRIAPLGLTLGEISARGELVWEAAGTGASLTRARLDLDGRDLGTALERLGQEAVIRSQETRVKSQLAWPGAPWQFALERSRGSVEAQLRDGRFVNLESTPARLVGLLNIDNLVRRLRLDFSDVTGQGTAFDRVSGAATLYGGSLETRGPVEVVGPATRFSLDGSVALARRELDMRLAVTLPVSRNLPLAAVIAGAPMVGGALFIADRLFGDVIDSVTRIHYRVLGPWTAPQISVESAE
ncbi:AsmA-like C-terminal region-containing protein [Halomonas sp. H10-9-1]|uniref:YhdP family phospholipid transporter n=1 Tax=Halomonas sp. H10-9-1 TaxID=2950871 RepID=UPI0032DED2FE